MAVHYCLLCDGKFKKYNQAITHYDAVHSLAAPLACDQCEQTFRDMYSCVKHKHELHGIRSEAGGGGGGRAGLRRLRPCVPLR
jgi:hypothetical protein